MIQENKDHIYHVSFLERLDIFGVAIGIRFNQFKSHKTVFGGVVTLLIIGVLIFQATRILANVFQQDDPRVLQQLRYVQEQELFNLTSTTFNFAIGVQDSSALHFKDESIYKMTAIQQIGQRVLNMTTGQYDQIWTYQEIKVEECTQQHFKIPESYPFFEKLPLEKLYCISLNQTEVGIEGEFSNASYRAVQFLVDFCSNDTSIIPCSSNEIINARMQSPRLAVYVSDSFINVTNRDKPYYHIGRNLFWPSSIEFAKEIFLNFQNVYIDSDFGLWEVKSKLERTINYSSSREIMTVRHSQTIFNFLISYEKNQETRYNRSYVKIDSAFSQIGGFFNILISIGCILCWPISQLELNRKLINHAFDVNLETNEGNKFQFKWKKDDEIIQDDKDQKLNETNHSLDTSGTHQNELDKQGRMKSDPAFFHLPNQPLQLKKEKSSGNPTSLCKISTHQLLKRVGGCDLQKAKSSSIFKNKPRSQTQTFQQNQQLSSFTRIQQKNNINTNADCNKAEQQNSKKNSTNKNDNNNNSNMQKNTIWRRFQNFIQGGKKKSDVKIQSQEQNIFLQRKKKEIKISFFDYLKNYFQIFSWCQSPNSQLIKRGTDLLYSHIDIFNIVTKLVEIDKLKVLLLNDHQIKLFDFLPRPSLTPQAQKDHSNHQITQSIFSKAVKQNSFTPSNKGFNDMYSYKNRPIVQKAKEAQESFDVLRKKVQSPIDSKIIQLLDIPIEEKKSSEILDENAQKNEGEINLKEHPKDFFQFLKTKNKQQDQDRNQSLFESEYDYHSKYQSEYEQEFEENENNRFKQTTFPSAFCNEPKSLQDLVQIQECQFNKDNKCFGNTPFPSQAQKIKPNIEVSSKNFKLHQAIGTQNQTKSSSQNKFDCSMSSEQSSYFQEHQSLNVAKQCPDSYSFESIKQIEANQKATNCSVSPIKQQSFHSLHQNQNF